MQSKNWILLVCFFISTSANAKLALQPLITEGIQEPTFVTVAPNDKETLYVVQQAGTIRGFKNGKPLPKPFLNIESKVASGGEMGLLSVAFHPKFAQNGKYYVDYDIRVDKETGTPPSNIWTVISEFAPGAAEKELLRIHQPYTNHKGGQLAFDAKGFLYIGMGDGGKRADPHGNGQNKNALLGKILRIDVDKPDSDRKTLYSIPSDNPFAKGGGSPEIFALGLRNPWRFSFDRKTNALFAADVGQDVYEEIDRIELGKNYGWNTMEAKHCFSPPQACDASGLTLPLWEYKHDGGSNSVTGGYVYRGSKISSLQGLYIYADYGSGKIWGLTLDEAQKRSVKNEELLDSKLPISSFGEDAEGEILVASYDGRIFRLVEGK